MEGVEKKQRRRGQVKVAKYYPGKPLPLVSEGFENILIHTKGDNLGGDLSPYVLRDENGHLLENIWQFSKLYPSVSAQRIPLSRWQRDHIIWEHPAEVHAEEKYSPTEAYWEWRKKGFAAPYAVRYPNGFAGRHKCVGAIVSPTDLRLLGYIESRKAIYCALYRKLAPHTPHFKTLYRMLDEGKNIQIVEVDGPDPTLNFPPYDKISPTNPGLLMDEDTIRMLLNDERKPFGHGFVIAALLLDGGEWLAPPTPVEGE